MLTHLPICAANTRTKVSMYLTSFRPYYGPTRLFASLFVCQVNGCFFFRNISFNLRNKEVWTTSFTLEIEHGRHGEHPERTFAFSEPFLTSEVFKWIASSLADYFESLIRGTSGLKVHKWPNVIDGSTQASKPSCFPAKFERGIWSTFWADATGQGPRV